MSLKKFLKRFNWKESKKGQSVLEYFILLTLLASLTILTASTLFHRTQHDVEEFTNAAAAAMAPPV